MSLEGQREEIAAALSTVAGVTGSRYRPRALAPGSAWPLLVDLARTGETPGLLVTWRVCLVLPADEEQAAVWFDAHVDLIDEALADAGYVARFEPGLVATDLGDLQAMFVTIRREG